MLVSGKRRGFLTGIALFFCTAVGAGGNSDSVAVYSISRLQIEAEQWTRKLKKRYDRKSQEYDHAQKLYFEARASVNAWLNQIETDVRAKHDIRMSEEAQAAQLEATSKAQKLVDYLNQVFAKGLNPGAAAIIVAVGKVVSDTASEIGKQYLQLQKEIRKEQLEAFLQQLEQLKWKEFDAL